MAFQENKFNLAFTAAHLVGYIIQQLMVGAFLLLGKLNKALDITGNLGKIASSLKKAGTAVGGFIKKGAVRVAKLVKEGLLEPAAKHVRKLLDKFGFTKWGDEAIDYASAGMSRLAIELGDDLAEIITRFDPEDWKKYCELLGKADEADKASAIQGLIKHAANSPEWAAKGSRWQLDRIYARWDDIQDVERRFTGARIDALIEDAGELKILECKCVSDNTLKSNSKWTQFKSQMNKYHNLNIEGAKRDVLVEFKSPLNDQNVINKLDDFKSKNAWFDYDII